MSVPQLKLPKEQIKQVQTALLMFPKELRLDASVMMAGHFIQGAMPGANLIGAVSKLEEGLDAVSSEIKGKLTNALGSFSGLSSHAGLQGIAAIGKAVQGFDQAQGIVTKLFHGNLAQIGPANFAELMKLKGQFMNLRIHDMDLKGVAPKLIGAIKGLPMIRKDLTIPEIENYIWSHVFKKNGMGHIAMRSFPRTAFKGMFKK